MSRQWLGVPPHCLCQQHLLGEHAEHHQEIGSIESGNVASVRGHIDAGQFFPSMAVERHELLVAEHEKRGGNHNSPLDVTDAREQYPALFIPKDTVVDRRKNRRDLAERCSQCRSNLQAAGYDTETGKDTIQ